MCTVSRVFVSNYHQSRRSHHHFRSQTCSCAPRGEEYSCYSRIWNNHHQVDKSFSSIHHHLHICMNIQWNEKYLKRKLKYFSRNQSTMLDHFARHVVDSNKWKIWCSCAMFDTCTTCDLSKPRVFGENRTYITDNSITHCKQNIASIR